MVFALQAVPVIGVVIGLFLVFNLRNRDKRPAVRFASLILVLKSATPGLLLLVIQLLSPGGLSLQMFARLEGWLFYLLSPALALVALLMVSRKKAELIRKDG